MIQCFIGSLDVTHACKNVDLYFALSQSVSEGINLVKIRAIIRSVCSLSIFTVPLGVNPYR